MWEGRFGAEFRELEAAVKQPQAQLLSGYWDHTFADLIAGGALPVHLTISQLANLCAARAAAFLSAGRPDEALLSWQIAIRLHHGVDGRNLTDLMLRYASIQLSLGPVWQGGVTKRWSPEQLEVIEANLATIDLLADALTAFRGDLIWCAEAFDYSKSRWPWNEHFLGGEGRWLLCLPAGWWDFNKANSSRRIWRRLILPVKGGSFPAPPTALPSGFRPHALFADVSESAYQSISIQGALTMTLLNLARTGCALDRFHARHGRYSVELAELVPEFLPAVLTDTTRGGAPLHYRLLEGGSVYRIYALGEDGDDDRGEIALSSGGWRNKRAGDIVWTNQIGGAVSEP